MDIFGNEPEVESTCPYCKNQEGHHEECPEANDFEDTPEIQEVIEDFDALPFMEE